MAPERDTGPPILPASPRCRGAAPGFQSSRGLHDVPRRNAPSQRARARVRDLRKTYDNGVQALKGVSLDVRPGDFFALLGPNGAGKSTLIGIVSSLVNKTAGAVRSLRRGPRPRSAQRRCA